MSDIQKPSPIQPFKLSSLVSKLEEQSEQKDETTESSKQHHHQQQQLYQKSTPSQHLDSKNGHSYHRSDISEDSVNSALSDHSLFNNMSLVSPAFTPVPGSFKTEDIFESGKSETQELAELPNVYCESRARIPTTNGAEIFLHLYKNDQDNKEHLAIVFGQHIHSKTLFDPRPGETEHDRMTRGAYVGKLYPGREKSTEDASSSTEVVQNKNKETLVRIHSECYTGETAWSARCDCGEQLDEAARLMALEGSGVIVYLRQEGRGIGLGEKLKAYNLQDLGADTVTANLMLRHPADGRSFGLATAILKDLGQDRIRLLTNNPDKIKAVEGKHKEVKVTQRVPMVPLSWQNKGGFRSREVEQYLKTKVERMGHMLPLSDSN